VRVAPPAKRHCGQIRSNDEPVSGAIRRKMWNPLKFKSEYHLRAEPWPSSSHVPIVPIGCVSSSSAVRQGLDLGGDRSPWARQITGLIAVGWPG
jgi:hypothetical protein